MFTGLIERTAKVLHFLPLSDDPKGSILRLTLDPGAMRYKTALGDSVAVNGCCLTVVSNHLGMLAFDISRETMSRTSLGSLAENDWVNLERALAVGDRLGGHLVSGHIDTTGTIQNISKNPDGWQLRVDIPRALGRYIIHKGSICIDGVSLTVNDLDDSEKFTTVHLTLIPKTVESTTFCGMNPGRTVNIEVDQIGKFIERLQEPWQR